MEKLYGKFLHALIVNLLLLASLFASSVTAEQKPVVETGEASFYTDSLDGRKTASGEPSRACDAADYVQPNFVRREGGPCGGT